jgi:glycosyltransferase involved in cell wall biosynthesis
VGLLGSSVDKAIVVIPAYNEAKAIGRVVGELRAWKAPVVVVDDGSTDDTPALAEKAGAVVLRNGGNKGKGEALLRGFRYALEQGRELILTFDGDGQHDPSLLPTLLRAQEESHADVVLGRRRMSWRDMPPLRFATNRCMSAVVTWMGGRRIEDTQCGLRLFRDEVVRSLLFGPRPKVVSHRYAFESELLIEACYHKFRVVEVPVPTIYNGEASSIRPFWDTVRFFGMMIRIMLRR